jgi:hypothetical protein
LKTATNLAHHLFFIEQGKKTKLSLGLTSFFKQNNKKEVFQTTSATRKKSSLARKRKTVRNNFL